MWKNTKSNNPLVSKAINGETILSKWVVRNTKKSRFIKKRRSKRIIKQSKY